MKISKLFHWLYAFLMLLPVFAIGGTMLIYTFNSRAKDDKEITYKYESNEVYTANDLQVGNIYHFTINQAPSSTYALSLAKAVYNVPFLNTDTNSIVSDTGYIQIEVRTNQIIFRSSVDNVWLFSIDNSKFSYPFEFDMVLYEYRANGGYDYKSFSKTDFNVIDEVEDVVYGNVFYDSIDKVTVSPLFSWAYNSFLVAPFQYIMALFGVPSNHVIVEFLSYWLAVSIIWLIFDVVMYVPLLAHRWLDKGVIE